MCLIVQWRNVYVVGCAVTDLYTLKFYTQTHKCLANISGKTKKVNTGLFLSFRRVLNVNYSFLGNSPASEF